MSINAIIDFSSKNTTNILKPMKKVLTSKSKGFGINKLVREYEKELIDFSFILKTNNIISISDMQYQCSH